MGRLLAFRPPSMPLARGMGAKPEQPVVAITIDREITCSPLLSVCRCRFGELNGSSSSWTTPAGVHRFLSPPAAAPPLTCGVLVWCLDLDLQV